MEVGKKVREDVEGVRLEGHGLREVIVERVREWVRKEGDAVRGDEVDVG